MTSVMPQPTPPTTIDMKSTTSAPRTQCSTSEEPKLRNSCHACASSKLKCSQDKPTCTRCAKRGLDCKYVIAKRGGRKPKGWTAESEAANSPHSANGQWHPTNWSVSSSSGSPPGSNHRTPRTLAPAPNALQDFYGPADPTSCPMPPTSVSTDMDIDFNEYFSMPLMNTTEMPLPNTMFPFDNDNMFASGMGSSRSGSESVGDAFGMSEDEVSELFAMSIPTSTPPTNFSMFPEQEMLGLQDGFSPLSGCFCLVQALSLMKQLVPVPPSTGLSPALQNGTYQTIISRNETTVEAVSQMLNCPSHSCSQDGYLLSVMSLIIFKVLGWYAAVAQQTTSSPSPDQRSRQSSVSTQGSRHNSIDGADSARIAAQLVLNEIHRVRHVIEQLSAKLKVQAAKDASREQSEAMQNGMDMDVESRLPLSAVMYDQLDADLRRRLKALSWEMLDRLKRF